MREVYDPIQDGPHPRDERGEHVLDWWQREPRPRPRERKETPK